MEVSSPEAKDLAHLSEPKNKSNNDGLFKFKPAKDEQIRTAAAWMQDSKYFKRVMVSNVAATKMLNHAVSGVEKGMKSAGGKPVEVMGLMMGRPSQYPLDHLIVTDVFPLPVEGAETRVLADDQEVMNYMINLGESLEKTRKERFMGWYHSHPFDVEVHSHCFLSGTDVNTQLAWQNSEDRNGNPWLAIVVDPLRSLAKGKPEFGAFRVYPAGETPPANVTPDGKITTDENKRIERWGSCWASYYQLEISYFSSSLSARISESISKNVLWMNTLTSTPAYEPESRDRFAERINALTEKLKTTGGKMGGAMPNKMLSMISSSDSKGKVTRDTVVGTCAQSSKQLSHEQCQTQTAQIAKYLLFSRSRDSS